MGKADVLALASGLSTGQSDGAGTVDRYFHDAIVDFAMRGWSTKATLVSVTEGTATYTMAATVVSILGVLFDDHQLSPESPRTLEAVNPHWRDVQGSPIAYTPVYEDERTIRLYPNPDTSAKSIAPVHGAPFGLDFPGYWLVAITNDYDENVQDWYTLPLALAVLEHEFAQSSPYQDLEFAEAAKQLAKLLFALLV